VIIDNRPGAAGDIGMDLAAKSPPDGYTLTMVSVNHAVNPSVTIKQPYSLTRDFAPITRTTMQAYVLVVNLAVPAKSVSELIALARSKPEGLLYASGGTGGLTHLAGALLGLMTSTNLVHVPYKGGGPALIGLIAGDAQLQFSDAVGAAPHVRAGRVRGLGVTTLKRQAAFPELPTLAEAGVPGYEVTSWYGMLAPAKTPTAIVSKINSDIWRILRAPEVTEQFARMGAESSGTTPGEFAAFIRSEIAKWERVVKQAGIR
jgi:tripartite-type tricarboxylate transporter receptor subunit TctC